MCQPPGTVPGPRQYEWNWLPTAITRCPHQQQMRWSRKGADLLLQVRGAVYNGTLGSGFGQKFQPANDLYRLLVVAA
jgi:hypothetical protein